MAGETFRSTFTIAQLIKAVTVDVVAGEIVRLGEYKVQAGEFISIGAGQISSMDGATGRIYMHIADNGAAPGTALGGSVRLVAYTAQNRVIEILGEWRTEDLDTVATDKTKQLPLPEHPLWLREDERLCLEFIADVDGTVGKTNTKILVAMTKQVQ